MNKTDIEWCDYTWNPITGCKHGCPYCYAEKVTKRFGGDVRLNMNHQNCKRVGEDIFELSDAIRNRAGQIVAFPLGFHPTLHKYRLKGPKTFAFNAKKIFVCSMADMFGDWVPDRWITKIFEACKENGNNNYLFLTKNPKRYIELEKNGLLPKDKNFWFGSTITNSRTNYLYTNKVNTFLSIEPLLEEFTYKEYAHTFKGIDWVIIGAETGNRRDKVVPKKEWVNAITKACDDCCIPVFMKDSLINIVGEENMRREFPEALAVSELSDKEKAVLESRCGKCKKVFRKKDMTAVSVRKGRRGAATTIGFICDECLPEFQRGFDYGDDKINE